MGGVLTRVPAAFSSAGPSTAEPKGVPSARGQGIGYRWSLKRAGLVQQPHYSCGRQARMPAQPGRAAHRLLHSKAVRNMYCVHTWHNAMLGCPKQQEPLVKPGTAAAGVIASPDWPRRAWTHLRHSHAIRVMVCCAWQRAVLKGFHAAAALSVTLSSLATPRTGPSVADM